MFDMITLTWVLASPEPSRRLRWLPPRLNVRVRRGASCVGDCVRLDSRLTGRRDRMNGRRRVKLGR